MNGRVLILTGASPERPGGVEHFVRQLVSALQARGYSTEVFHARNSLPSWLASPGGKLRRYIAGSLLGYFVARSARRRLGPDVVAVISNSDVGWCAPSPPAQGAKRIHMYHGTYRGQSDAIRPFISSRGRLYLKWWSSGVLERLGGRHSIVLCNSKQTQAEVSRFFGWQGALVWLPLDLEQFAGRDRFECRRRLGLSESATYGLFVGSTNPAKGFGTLRQVMEKLPSVEWILAFGGDVPRDLEQTPRVRILREISTSDLPAIYSAADFSVFPSYYESFGYVVAESLACGTPVIAAPGGASREFLVDPPLDQFLIADPGSADDFAAAAREILKEPGFYQQKVRELAHPRIQALMGLENWWKRFSEATGL